MSGLLDDIIKIMAVINYFYVFLKVATTLIYFSKDFSLESYVKLR